MQTVKWLPIALLVLGLAACAGGPNTRSENNGASTQGQGANGSRYGAGNGNGYGQEQQGQNEGEQQAENGGQNENDKLSKLRIFFSFDSSDIEKQYKSILDAHAHYLLNHPQAEVRLQGNTDERGTREYNIGLGARRAKSVAHYLEMQGVPSKRITTISYGEERPLATGHNEKAWAKNRRVKIVYTNRGPGEQG